MSPIDIDRHFMLFTRTLLPQNPFNELQRFQLSTLAAVNGLDFISETLYPVKLCIAVWTPWKWVNLVQ